MRRPSLVQVVTDLQSQSRVGGNVSIPPEDGWAQTGREIAADFKRIADQVGGMADQAARREGEADGRGAGLDPEFRTRGDGTFYSEAFNRAGLDIAETRLRSVLDQQIDKLQDEHGASPKKLAESIDGVISGTIGGAPAELQPKLQVWAGHKRVAAMRTAQRELVARTRAEATAAQQQELTDGLRALSQMGYRMGLDAEADQVLGERVAALEGVLGRRGVDGRPLLDPKMSGRLREAARQTVAEARLKGAFSRLETPAEQAAFLARMDEEFKGGKGLAGQFGLDKFEALRSELEGEMRRAEAGRSVMRRGLVNQVKAVQTAAERGLPPATDDIIRLKASVAAIPELAADLQKAEATLQFVGGFRRLPTIEQEAWLEQERLRLADQGARTSGGDVERLAMAERLLGEARTALKTDPLGWAERTGAVEVTPLSLTSARTLADSLPQRVAQADEVARRFDLEPRYLRPEEARRLTALAAGGGRDLLEVVEGLAAAGPEVARRMLAELNETGAATLAAVGGHMQQLGRSGVALDVADGVALSRTKDFKGLSVSKAGAREMSASVHQGALAGFPKQEQALIDATNYAYQIRLQRQGKVDDDGIWKQTMRELLGERSIAGQTFGGITRYRGQAVVVPPDIRQDGLADLVQAIEIEDFDVPPMTAGQRTASRGAIRQAKLVPAGAGRFFLNVGDDDAPQWLGRPDGDKFVLDLAALKPRLRQRRPDLYIDGGAVVRPRISIDDTGGAGGN